MLAMQSKERAIYTLSAIYTLTPAPHTMPTYLKKEDNGKTAETKRE